MNPYNLLTKEDKDTFIDYCKTNANAIPNNLEKVLYQWNKNNKKLCKMLGNNLRQTFHIKCRMDKEYYHEQLKKLYHQPNIKTEYRRKNWVEENDNHPFVNSIINYIRLNENVDIFDIQAFCDFLLYDTIEYGSIKTLFSHKFNYKNKKELFIQPKTKTMRAIRKVIEYFDYPDMQLFYDWRDKISLINTDKEVEADLVLSIHPLDYITLSDNESGWSSCYSWRKKGGYSAAPIEMMNSNMAVVCYLVNKDKPNMASYGFNNIPNKSWRTLLFVHKNILLVGKHYYFQSKVLADKILDISMELLEKNLG